VILMTKTLINAWLGLWDGALPQVGLWGGFAASGVFIDTF